MEAIRRLLGRPKNSRGQPDEDRKVTYKELKRERSRRAVDKPEDEGVLSLVIATATPEGELSGIHEGVIEQERSANAVKKFKDRRGLSPVIATVILVAVAITVAVSVAYWMSGIAGQYTSFEKIELPAHYSKFVDTISVTGEAVGTGPGTTFPLAYFPVVAGSETIHMTITGEAVGTGDVGGTTDFPLDYDNIVPDSETVYLDSVAQPDGTAYTLVDATGMITFTPAPGDGVVITADYQCTLTDPDDYGLDYSTGVITLSVAAPDGAVIMADYSRDDWEAFKGWKEYIELKNSGSKDATITNVFLNNIPINDYGGISLFLTNDLALSNKETDLSAISIVVAKGDGVKLIIWIPTDTEGCSPGTTIDLKIVSAAGSQYPLLEVLA